MRNRKFLSQARKDLFELGFVYHSEIKSFRKWIGNLEVHCEPFEDYQRRIRFKIYLVYRPLENDDEVTDVVYCNSFVLVSLKKFMFVLETLKNS